MGKKELKQAGLFYSKNTNGTSFSDPAFATNKISPVHRWVPWIAGFSRDFVQSALVTYLRHGRRTVLDPFAGVGTTLVEALLSGHNSLGFEINPYASLACRTKLLAFQVNQDEFRQKIDHFIKFMSHAETYSEPSSKPPKGFSTRAPFYSPNVLRKVLFVQDFIDTLEDEEIRNLFRVAFASTMVTYSNYSYEPSLGRRVSAGKSEIVDSDVAGEIAQKLSIMLEDIGWLKESVPDMGVSANVFNESFFDYASFVEPQSVDIVITSPPYVNNYHYNRNTRPHLYWLGFAQGPNDIRPLENKNFGTYWQTARGELLIDLDFELPNSDLHVRLNELRLKNPEKGVYGGNGWANYASHYFNDCRKLSLGLDYVLRPGGTALLVVGPSILQGIFIETDRYLAEIAQSVGLELVEIHVPRTTRVGNSIIQSDVRSNKATDLDTLYEAVVELRKP